jgi:hypothetical protein
VRRRLRRCPCGDACDARPLERRGELDAHAIVGEHLETGDALANVGCERRTSTREPVGGVGRRREQHDERTRRLVGRDARFRSQLDGDALRHVKAAEPQHVGVREQSSRIARRADEQEAVVRHVRRQLQLQLLLCEHSNVRKQRQCARARACRASESGGVKF